jgi:excisionase family DNA binding protein
LTNQITPVVSNSEVFTPTNQWLTSNEAAAHLKVAPRTLLLWVRQGKIKGHVLSGVQRQTWRFRQAELDACFKENPVQ